MVINNGLPKILTESENCLKGSVDQYKYLVRLMDYDRNFIYGKIDLEKKIATRQIKDNLILAVQHESNFPTPEGRVRICAYRKPDKSTFSSFFEGLKGNGYEHAFNYFHCGINYGQALAAEAGRSYWSDWDFGLGVLSNNKIIHEWYNQRLIPPLTIDEFLSTFVNYVPNDTDIIITRFRDEEPIIDKYFLNYQEIEISNSSDIKKLSGSYYSDITLRSVTCISSLDFLLNMPKIVKLCFFGSEGFKTITSLTNLQYLREISFIYCDPISDFNQLKEFKNLRKMYFFNAFTNEFLKKDGKRVLKEALPHCNIEWECE